MKVDHYELFYLTGNFMVHNFMETYLENSTFCSEGSVQNPPPNSLPNENFSINLGNKSRIILPQDYFSNIYSGIDTPIPSQEKFNSVLPLVITLPILIGTNSTIPSQDIFRFHLGTCLILQNITMILQPTSTRLTNPRYI